jgi:hypothetical protein
LKKPQWKVIVSAKALRCIERALADLLGSEASDPVQAKAENDPVSLFAGRR